MSSRIWRWTADEMAHAIRTQRISSRDAVKSCLDRLEAMRRMLDAHHLMLAISTLGLPGLAVPTGLVEGVPMGVQLVAARFQEELCLAATEVIEARCSMKMPFDA